jgi:hypothetical protein
MPYETVEKTMGGREAMQDLFRLFGIPGLAHCSGAQVHAMTAVELRA